MNFRRRSANNMWAANLDLFFIDVAKRNPDKFKYETSETNYKFYAYPQQDENKYLKFVLDDVLKIPDFEKGNDKFRWEPVYDTIKDVRDYWDVSIPHKSRNEIEEKSMAASERTNHAPRLACLAAVSSFNSPVDATIWAVKAWASAKDDVIEVDGNPVCVAKWEASKRYSNFFTSLG